MGLTLAIYPIPDQVDAAIAFPLIVEALLRRGTFKKAEFNRWAPSGPSNSAQLAYSQATVSQVADVASQSEGVYTVYIVFELRNGISIPVDLRLYGVQYGAGAFVRQYGQIEVVFEYDDILAQVNWVENSRECIETRAMDRVGDGVLRSVDELFLRCCGAFAETEYLPVVHGAMCGGSGWIAPISCCAIYHRDTRDFATDFARIYAAFHCEARIPDLVGDASQIWALVAEREPGDCANDERLRRVVASITNQEVEAEAIKALARRLTRDIAVELSSLGPEDSELILTEVVSQSQDIALYEIVGQGFAVATSPTSTVRALYEGMLDKFLRNGSQTTSRKWAARYGEGGP